MRVVVLLAFGLLAGSVHAGGQPEVPFLDGFEQSFSVSGQVNGLQGSGMLLRLNDTEDLPITTNGAFSFSSRVALGSDYVVSIQVQPTNPAQSCALARASGQVTGPVTDVLVSCGANWDEFNWDQADWN